LHVVTESKLSGAKIGKIFRFSLHWPSCLPQQDGIAMKTPANEPLQSAPAAHIPVALPGHENGQSFQSEDARGGSQQQVQLQSIVAGSPQLKQMRQLQTLAQAGSLQRMAISVPPPLLPCGHRSHGVVQRMIDPKSPPKTKDLAELERYLYGTPVNARGQTFEHAASMSTVGRTWFGMLEAALAEQDIERVLGLIPQVIEKVNAEETLSPHHPNAVWHGKQATEEALQHEVPYTIAKTSESVAIANEMRTLIIRSKILGADAKFMMGVMVLPDGQLIVAFSGKRTKLLVPMAGVLSSFPLFGKQVYDTDSISSADAQTYMQDAATGMASSKHFEYDDGGKIVRKRATKKDQGSYPANCAAAVALSVAKQVSPKSFSKGGQLGLTEVFLSGNPKSEVLIYNKETEDGERFTMKHQDVPSCHVCQMQLQHVAEEVVAMEKAGIATRLETDILALDKASAAMKSDLATLQAQLAQKELPAEALEAMNDALATAILAQQEAEREVAEAAGQVVRANKELAGIHTGIANLETSIAESLARGRALSKQEADLERESRQAAKLEKEIQQLTQRVAQLESELAALNEAGGWKYALGGFEKWYALFNALQKQPAFETATPSDIYGKLTGEIETQRGELGKKEASRGASSQDLDQQASVHAAARRKLAEKRTEHTTELGNTKGMVGDQLVRIASAERGQVVAGTRMMQCVARTEALQASIQQARVAAKEASVLRREINNLNKKTSANAQESRRKEMSLQVYRPPVSSSSTASNSNDVQTASSLASSSPAHASASLATDTSGKAPVHDPNS
jgi:hypothetical protein